MSKVWESKISISQIVEKPPQMRHRLQRQLQMDGLGLLLLERTPQGFLLIFTTPDSATQTSKISSLPALLLWFPAVCVCVCGWQCSSHSHVGGTATGLLFLHPSVAIAIISCREDLDQICHIEELICHSEIVLS